MLGVVLVDGWRFNPTRVLLKHVLDIEHGTELKQLQSHKGSSETLASAGVLASADVGFNPTRVLLKLRGVRRRGVRPACFNPTRVLLKRETTKSRTVDVTASIPQGFF